MLFPAILIHLLALQGPVVPPRPDTPATSIVSGAGAPGFDIPRVDGAAATVKVDGVLDEPAWQRAARLGGFSEYRPVDGRPASDDTEVRVWYSATALHFGIIARDADPGAIRATNADREHSQTSRIWCMAIGTNHHSSRKCIVFKNHLVNNSCPRFPEADSIFI